jgi:ABC-type multidrug transport system fused ATPase/permease subunit
MKKKDKDNESVGFKGKVVQKPKNMWGTIKRLAAYVKKSSFMIILALIATIAGTVMQVYSPKRLGVAITLAFDGLRHGTAIDFKQVGVILLTVAAMYVGIFFTTFMQQRIMVLVAQKSTYTLRNELKVKMNKVPVSYFDKNANGNLMSVATNDIDNIVTNLQQSLTDLISSVVLMVGFFWMMISISPLLTGLACLIIPGTVIIMSMTTPKTKKYTKAYYKSLGELNAQIEETYQGFAVVKSFNGEDIAIQKFNSVNENMVKTGWKARFFGGLMMPSMSLVQNIIYVLIAVIGAVHVVAGTILIGDMTAFLQYSGQFANPIMKILQSWGNFIAMIASAERVFEMLDAEEMVEYNKEFPNHRDEAVKVAFDHVKFGYTDEPLMNDFSIDVQEGQMVAIVGHTGAGKTTLINLLERFYEIQDGSIRIDGIDIRNSDRQAVRQKIGMVLQDTWLFSGTIYDNIRYGNENATKEQIYAAAKAAYADDFIQKLPDGYNTVLNEDADNISQGQRQLITIARAFVSNPEILILDEATSNVDSRTELIIQSAMKRLLKGRTSFVVAHRLSTIYDADRILVMYKGDIVETGNHKELLAKNGVYADIYNSQFSHKSIA